MTKCNKINFASFIFKRFTDPKTGIPTSVSSQHIQLLYFQLNYNNHANHTAKQNPLYEHLSVLECIKWTHMRSLPTNAPLRTAADDLWLCLQPLCAFQTWQTHTTPHCCDEPCMLNLTPLTQVHKAPLYVKFNNSTWPEAGTYSENMILSECVWSHKATSP